MHNTKLTLEQKIISAMPPSLLRKDVLSEIDALRRDVEDLRLSNQRQHTVVLAGRDQSSRLSDLLNQLLVELGIEDEEGNKGGWTGPDLCVVAQSAIASFKSGIEP